MYTIMTNQAIKNWTYFFLPPVEMNPISRCIRLSVRRTPSSVFLARQNHTQNSSQHVASSDPPRTTSFGYKTVPEESKESLVKNVFDSVASSYDLMNDATSLGVHRLWKDTFVSSLKPGRKGAVRCIDVAGGTGDIALRILDHARENYADRETTVEVVDINGQMLKEGFRRFKKTMYHNSKLRLLRSPYLNLCVCSASNLVSRGKCTSTTCDTI